MHSRPDDNERIAAQLLPAARAAIAFAAPAPGTRVIDVGCGTGNALLLAAEQGAQVTGVDPSQRLLNVSRERARARRLNVNLVRGEAASMPVPHAAADVVISVFGVILAPSPSAAATEIARVTAPGGRLVLCAWLPGSPVLELIRIRREAAALAVGAARRPSLFPWHDPDTLNGLFAHFGFLLNVHEKRLVITGASPEEFVKLVLRGHSLRLSDVPDIVVRRKEKPVVDRAFEIFNAANEQPGGFRATCRYIVATLDKT